MLFHSSLSPNPSHPSSSSSHATNPAHPNPHAAANANANAHTNGNHVHSVPPPPLRTPLSVLRADELTILTRKANIRRFGAGWLRPMGVAKTLQGLADEMAEREEVAAGGREFAQANAPSTSPTASLHDSPPPRDLDDDVPNADDADGAWVDEDEEEDEDAHHGRDEDLDLDNVMEEEDDLLPGEEDDDAEGDGDYAPQRLQQPLHQHELDLDAEIPEADGDGGYEHTDTEVEDESSFDMEYGVLGRSVWGTDREGMGGVVGRGVGSGVTSSSFVGGGDETIRVRRASAGHGVVRVAVRGDGRAEIIAGNAVATASGRRRRSSRGGGGAGGGGGGGGRENISRSGIVRENRGSRRGSGVGSGSGSGSGIMDRGGEN